MGSLNFYSQLQRAVEKAPAKMDGMPAQQWLQWLESNASKLAVKKDEIEWSGIKEYLALQGRQRLFRQDLGAFLQENGVRVEEVQLGRAAPDPKDFYDGLASDLYGTSYEELSDRAQGEIRYMAEERAKAKGAVNSTNYSTHVIPGGGNYREVLITLPMRRAKVDFSGWTAQLRREVSPVTRKPEYEIFDANGVSQGVSRSSADEQDAILATARVQERVLSERMNYKSSHWDQRNVLAHLRVDDRVDADGKRVLFINEIQSDWAQEGRINGFSGPGSVLKGTAVADGFGAWKVFWQDGTFSGGYSQEAAQAKAAEGRMSGVAGKPAAPFVEKTDAWVGLALKRVVSMAVEGGYDRVALISGQQAADLYSLRTQVDRVYVTKLKKGGLEFSAYKGGQDVFLRRTAADKTELAEYIGKGLADKADAQALDSGKAYEGLELDIGGEGMLAFYDQIVPQVARDVLKKLGGKPLEMVRFVPSNDGMFAVFKPDGALHVGSDGKPVLYSSMAKARAAATKLNRVNGEGHKADEAPTQGGMQLGFDITPAMREMVLAGMPLFSLAEGNQVLDNPSSPDAVRTVIADLVGLDAEQLQEGVGRLVVTTSDQVADQVQAARKAAFDAWFAGSMVVDAEGKPQVMYHGSYRDLEGGVFDRMKSAEIRAVSMDTVGSWFSDNPSEDGGAGMYAQGERARIYPVYLNIHRPKVYATFNDFLRDMHESEGRSMEAQKVAAIGSTEGLRQKLKAQGYDGIAFQRTDNEALHQEISEYQAAVRSARSDEFGVPRQERQMYTVKRERLEQKLKSLVDELNAMGGSTEFDKQYVWVAFEPEQIKSAIGNRGTYDPRDPDITHSLAPARAQAFHDRQSGTTYFLADRIPAGKEASVFLHEVVHRHGRAHLPDGQFGALVGQVKAWAGHAQGSTERSIHDKAAGRVAAAGVSGPVADEELFAYAVEEAVAMGVQPSAMAHEGSAEAWLQAVVQSIQRVADKLIGNSLAQLDGQDLVDLAYALAQVERPELGAVVAQALQEHCRISLQPTFCTESRDGPSGQQNLTLRARLAEESVGYIDYTVYRDVPAIQYVWVDEKHRREGVAGAMVRELQREFPDQEIEWGMLTDDGAKFYESLSKQYIENPEFLDLKARLDGVLERLAHHKRLGEQFDALCSPTEQQRREFLEAVNDWNDLHDERFELTQALYDVRPGRVMILRAEQAALEEVPFEQETASMAL